MLQCPFGAENLPRSDSLVYFAKKLHVCTEALDIQGGHPIFQNISRNSTKNIQQDETLELPF